MCLTATNNQTPGRENPSRLASHCRVHRIEQRRAVQPSVSRLHTPDGKLNRIADCVRQRQTSLILTQDALCARLADVTDGAWVADRRDIFRIEDGRRSVHDVEMVALAKALEVSVGWLLGENAKEEK